jgi:small subunit ribosomal protein S5
LHDFFTQFGKTKIFVEKKPEGYGLVCHRAIREICQAVGIKDIYAKVEGSTKNVQHVTKAFIIGLLNQVVLDLQKIKLIIHTFYYFFTENV